MKKHWILGIILTVFLSVGFYPGGLADQPDFPLIYIDEGSAGTHVGSAANPYDDLSDLNWDGGGDNDISVAVGNNEDVVIHLMEDDTWREQLTVGTSGSAAHPITITSYGAGAKPIINGADLVAPWTQSGGHEWEDNFNDNDLTGWDVISGGVVNQNERLEVTIAGGGNDYVRETITDVSEYYATCRVYFNSLDTWNNTNTIQMILGLRSGPERIDLGLINSAGTNYWRVFYAEDGGSTSSILSSAAAVVTATWYDIAVHWKSATGIGSVDGILQAWCNGIRIFNKTDADTDTLTVSQIAVGNINPTAGVDATLYIDDLIVDVSNLASGNIWKATLATTPNQVFLDTTQGNEQTALTSVDSANDWFYLEGDSLYVYSVADPDGAYTSPGIEAFNRTRCLYMGEKNYITIDGLHLTHCNGTWGTVGGAFTSNSASNPVSNVIIQNCTINYNNWAGIEILGYSGGESTAITIADNTVHDNVLTMGTGGDIWSDFMDSSTISGNTVYNSGEHGIRIRRGDSNTIERNTCYANGSSGITLTDAASGSDKPTGNIVRYNECYGNDAVDGAKSNMEIWNSGTGNYFYCNLLYASTTNGARTDAGDGDFWYNNVIYNSGSIGFFAEGANNQNLTIKNNIIHTATNELIRITNGSEAGIDINYNSYYPDGAAQFDWLGTDYTFANWLTNSGQDANSLIADPLMTDPAGGDFTLSYASPCINKGTAVGLTEDYLGIKIRHAPDIGAYENQTNVIFSQASVILRIIENIDLRQ